MSGLVVDWDDDRKSRRHGPVIPPSDDAWVCGAEPSLASFPATGRSRIGRSLVTVQCGKIAPIPVGQRSNANRTVSSSDGSRMALAESRKIGRESGRESGCQYVYITVVAVSLKKKQA